MPRRFASQDGFTYIAALVIVVIMGIMLGMVNQSIATIMKREREKELIFRGLQYRDALESWQRRGGQPLQRLEDLLKDPRTPNGDRLLRRLYEDPFTGKAMKELKDPNLGIYGVVSTSSDEPLKKANFPEVIKTFEGKSKYSEWEFVYKRQVTPAGSSGGRPNPAQQATQAYPLSEPEGP